MSIGIGKEINGTRANGIDEKGRKVVEFKRNTPKPSSMSSAGQPSSSRNGKATCFERPHKKKQVPEPKKRVAEKGSKEKRVVFEEDDFDDEGEFAEGEFEFEGLEGPPRTHNPGETRKVQEWMDRLEVREPEVSPPKSEGSRKPKSNPKSGANLRREASAKPEPNGKPETSPKPEINPKREASPEPEASQKPGDEAEPREESGKGAHHKDDPAVFPGWRDGADNSEVLGSHRKAKKGEND